MNLQQRLNAERFAIREIKTRRDDPQRRFLEVNKLDSFLRVILNERFERDAEFVSDVTGKPDDCRPGGFLCGKFLAGFQKEKRHRKYQVNVHARLPIQFLVTIHSFSATDNRILPSNTAKPLRSILSRMPP